MSDATMKNAHKAVGGKGKANLALELVGYEAEVDAAMRYTTRAQSMPPFPLSSLIYDKLSHASGWRLAASLLFPPSPPSRVFLRSGIMLLCPLV